MSGAVTVTVYGYVYVTVYVYDIVNVNAYVYASVNAKRRRYRPRLASSKSQLLSVHLPRRQLLARHRLSI